MSIKDKLEIGLKPDAPYRRDNLSEHEQDDPCVEPGQPGETAEEKRAREACQKTEGDVSQPSKATSSPSVSTTRSAPASKS